MVILCVLAALHSSTVCHVHTTSTYHTAGTSSSVCLGGGAGCWRQKHMNGLCLRQPKHRRSLRGSGGAAPKATPPKSSPPVLKCVRVCSLSTLPYSTLPVVWYIYCAVCVREKEHEERETADKPKTRGVVQNHGGFLPAAFFEALGRLRRAT
jgi:hypothetical protein